MPVKTIEIGKFKSFELEAAKSKYMVNGLDLYFCDDLASECMPQIFDPYGYGRKPEPPEGTYYRIINKIGTDNYCFQYYVYWPRQECVPIDLKPSSVWRRLLRFLGQKWPDHKFDYEPILVFYDFPRGSPYLVVNNGLGENPTTHRIEIHSEETKERDDADIESDFRTSPHPSYPFGGHDGREIKEWCKKYPLMSTIYFNDRHPLFGVTMCSHVFSGGEKYYKKSIFGKKLVSFIEDESLEIELKRLNDEVLDEWYLKQYTGDEEPFGHDVSDPFRFPHIRYFDPKSIHKSKMLKSN